MSSWYLKWFGLVDMTTYVPAPPDPEFPFPAPATRDAYMDLCWDTRAIRQPPKGPFKWFKTKEEAEKYCADTF